MDIVETSKAWFVLHPFLRNELLLVFGSVSAYAKKDWESFKTYKLTDPHVAFNWRIAGFQYLQGAVIAIVPPIVAVIWYILGGS